MKTPANHNVHKTHSTWSQQIDMYLKMMRQQRIFLLIVLGTFIFSTTLQYFVHHITSFQKQSEEQQHQKWQPVIDPIIHNPPPSFLPQIQTRTEQNDLLPQSIDVKILYDNPRVSASFINGMATYFWNLEKC